jgi:hypothetical protein
MEPNGSLLRSHIQPLRSSSESLELSSTRLYKIHFNIILPPTARPLKRSLPFKIPDQKFVSN